MADALTAEERAELRRLAAEMSNAYFDHLTPRCGYVSAGDGMRCSLSSGHADQDHHVMMRSPPDGWHYVNVLRTALPRLLDDLAWMEEEQRKANEEADTLRRWAEEAAAAENESTTEMERLRAALTGGVPERQSTLLVEDPHVVWRSAEGAPLHRRILLSSIEEHPSTGYDAEGNPLGVELGEDREEP